MFSVTESLLFYYFKKVYGSITCDKMHPLSVRFHELTVPLIMLYIISITPESASVPPALGHAPLPSG